MAGAMPLDRVIGDSFPSLASAWRQWSGSSTVIQPMSMSRLPCPRCTG